MIVKLLIEHHLEFQSLKGGCRGSSESTLVKLLEISCRGSIYYYVKYTKESTFTTPDRRQSKVLILTTNEDQKLLETKFLIGDIGNQKHCFYRF